MLCVQVLGVMDAMPSSNLRPENEEDEAAANAPRIYRTTYMFSATMPPAVERLARKYLRRPVVVTIGSAGRATDNVTQRVVVVKDNEKPGRLETELDMVGCRAVCLMDGWMDGWMVACLLACGLVILLS